MTDSQVLAMRGRRAPRSMKLEKPAPLKRSVSPTIVEEKTFQGVRAPRRTNLKKPIPRSKSTSEEGTVKDTVIHEENDIQRAGMTPNTAKRTADSLITSTLADLKDTETSYAAAVKPRLKSQVSVDSGVGDCNNNRTSSFTCIGRHNSLHEVMLDEGFNEYPEDILAIEEELSSFDYSEQPSNRHCKADGEMKEQFIQRPAYHSSNRQCLLEREPNSFCRAEDIGVILSPSGQSYLERRGTSNVCIQYTADELLAIGMKPLSQKTPECWTYLVHVFPGVCLSKVDRFNASIYKEERGYVLENFYVKGRSNIPPMMETNFSQPRTGFGIPHKRNTDNQTNERKRILPTECDYSAVESDFQDLTIVVDQYQRNVHLFQRQADHPKPCLQPRITDAHRSHSIDPSIQTSQRSGVSVDTAKRDVPKVYSRHVDLDSKCDVSVRPDRGSMKLFAAAKNALKANTSRMVSIQLPTLIEERVQCTGTRAGRSRDTKMASRPNQYHEENFYINTDLPEKCFW